MGRKVRYRYQIVRRFRLSKSVRWVENLRGGSTKMQCYMGVLSAEVQVFQHHCQFILCGVVSKTVVPPSGVGQSYPSGVARYSANRL